MSCELHHAIVLLDTGRLSPHEARELEAHAAGCDACRETVERMRAANDVLSDYRPSPSPAARARVWEQMSAPRARSRDPVRFLIPVAAALAIAAVLIARDDDEEAALRIEVADGTRYQVVREDREHVQIELEHGRVFASVDPLAGDESFEVITRDARIVGRETSFIVDADGDATSVEVESGEIVLWPRSGALPVTLGAGRKLKLIAKKSIAAEQTHEEPPPAPIVLKRSSDRGSDRGSERRERTARERGAEQQANTLATARSVLAEDAPRAAALAEHVLKERPSERLEAEAVAVLADAQRRRGLAREAAELYRRVAHHREGRSFAEEALLQRALLIAQIEGPKAALEDLDEAAQRFPNGPTAPERTTLSARLHLALGDAAGAADVIERARVSGVSLSLLETRIAVGRALFDSQPERVRVLLAPALEPSAPEDIRRQAMDIIQGDMR